MEDDFFADLLPLKPKKAESKRVEPEHSSTNPTTSSSPGTAASRPANHQMADLLGSDPKDEIPEDFADSNDKTAPSNTEQAALMEKVVHTALHKFANALQQVLGSMTRQMDDLGSKVDQMTSHLHASQTSSKQNDAILEHLSSLASGVKDLQQSVKLVSERQEIADASASSKEAEVVAEKKNARDAKSTTPTQGEKTPTGEATSPTASLISNPSAVLPPGPSLPVPTVPPLPATAPPATPVEAPTAAPPPPSTPVEAAQNLQRYGSNASSVSQPGFAFGVPQQPRVQEHQGPPQNPFGSAPHQQQQQQYNPAPPPQTPQAGFQGSQQQPPPQAPQTPPYSVPPSHQPHSVPQQQPSSGPPQQPPRQFSSPAPQPYSGSYQQPQQAQQPGRQFYGSGSVQPPSGFRTQDNSPYAGSYGGPSSSQGFGGQVSGPSSYPPTPNLSPSSRYGSGSQEPGYGRPPAGSFGTYQSSRPESQRPPNQPSPQSVPLEKVIDDIANMGFSRHEARSVIQELQDKGQAIDLNVVLDRLMNGPRR